MEIIKLGDRLTIPGKNVKGEVVYIGKTHLGCGIWYGLILDDPVGKHNGTVENKRYFKCPKNHGFLIKASYFEKECGDINKAVEKRFCSSPQKIKYLRSSKGDYRHKTENAVRASKYLAKRKIKAESQNVSNYVVADNVTNINVDNTYLTKVAESGDNHNVSGEKVFKFIKRYPNYLKSSSHIKSSHFCLNKCKGKEYGDPAAHISNRYLISPIRERKNNPDEDENESPKIITYPNYLKSSSKLVGKHFCIAKSSATNDNGIENTAENAEESAKDFSNKNDTCKNTYTYLIKYPYQPRSLSRVQENYSCQAKRIKMLRTKLIPEVEQLETRLDNYMKCIPQITSHLEEVKHENERLKIRLQSTEVSQEDALKKLSEAQKEIKCLKYENECQRKQIKIQKSHLRHLTVVKGNSFKKSKEKLKEKEISETFETNVIAHRHDTNVSERKIEPENNKDTTSLKRVQELEQQNRLMIQGLVELRAFLQTQCKSQFIEPKPMIINKLGLNHNNRNRKRTFSKSIHSTPVTNPEMSATEKSEIKLREYSDMLQEMTKYNELTKEKGENAKEWETANLSKDIHLLQKPYFHDINHPACLSAQQPLCISGFDQTNGNYNNPIVKIKSDSFQITSTLQEKNREIQRNYETSFDLSSQHSHFKTQISGNTDHHITTNISSESADFTPNLSDQILTEDLFYNREFSMSNATLIEQEVPEYVKSPNSRILDQCPSFTMILPCMAMSSNCIAKNKDTSEKNANFQ